MNNQRENCKIDRKIRIGPFEPLDLVLVPPFRPVCSSEVSKLVFLESSGFFLNIRRWPGDFVLESRQLSPRVRHLIQNEVQR